MKVAIAVIVKDEAAEILPWICWYFNLNVSTLIIYDDSSTDGTFEVVQDASKIRDIRLQRVEPSLEFYTNRQQRCYIQTIENYADEFDWIGFLDADEYLALPKGEDLPSFLNRPADVGAVAINWCNYGSGGHVLKPRTPPFYAYTQHYAKEVAVNRHVKTFVRPKYWTGTWENPHFFDVSPLRYVDSVGREVSWAHIPGITRDEANWEGGKLMHYQCRSMEHFVERVRKRSDILAHPSLWASYDHGEVEDLSPRSQYEKIACSMYMMVRAMIERAVHTLADPYREELQRRAITPRFHPSPFSRLEELSPHSTAPTSSSQFSIQIRQVVTYFGRSLGTSALSGRIGSQASPNTPIGEHTVCAASISSIPNVIFLLRSNGKNAPLLVDQDPRILDILAYECVEVDGGARVALRQSSTKLFLAGEPPDVQGGLSASRHLVSDWEKFTLADSVDASHSLANDARLVCIRKFGDSDRNLGKFLCAYDKAELEVVYSAFPVLLRMLDQQQKAKIVAMWGAAAQYVI